MKISYEEAHEYLNSLIVFGVKLGLQNMEAMCGLLGNPQDDLKFVHVAGTNGKGSTCAMLASAMKSCGLKTGFYSSPFLYRFTERWRVDGLEVNESEVADAISEIIEIEDELVEKTGVRPTYFEVLTAAALLIFKQAGVDLVVWETGLGGRLDATNVVSPVLSLITNIEKDHTEYLGETLKEISFEKAGIIKEGVPFVLGDKKAEVQGYFAEVAESRDCKGLFRGRDYDLKVSEPHAAKLGFDRELTYSSEGKNVSLVCNFAGRHQADNAAAVLASLEPLCEVLDVSFEKALEGVSKAFWPGRFEFRENGMILDGAHNPIAAEALVVTLKELFPKKKFDFIVGVLGDKEWREILDILLPVASSFYFVDICNGRASDAQVLFDYVKDEGVLIAGMGSSKEALRAVKSPENTVVVGSLYLVGELLSILNDGEPLRVDTLSRAH